ncbi:hypothetical protein [Tenacibaculum agarivorans]|uniref:hypothetical protein n=1 Tax=Tenacibaculum agarivorans TaxID=1908389 RepID=UPI000AD86E0D|nr:hypothetical protein [Tenacibaculum agarivorans]
MKYINRIMMVIFVLLLFSGVFDHGNFAFAALFAIPLGAIQLLYCIFLGITWDNLKSNSKCFVGSYLLTVIGYSILWVKISDVNFNNNFLIQLIFYGLPIVLALSITAFLELKKFEY